MRRFRLGRLIGKEDLERFSAIAKSVWALLIRGLVWELTNDGLAAVRGNLREHSPWLVSGLSETLLLLAMFGGEIKAVPTREVLRRGYRFITLERCRCSNVGTLSSSAEDTCRGSSREGLTTRWRIAFGGIMLP